MLNASSTTEYNRCRHLFTEGRRCGSPAMRQENFCYHHHTTRLPAQRPKAALYKDDRFELPMPEDRAGIQHAIGMVVRRLAAGHIEYKNAALILYGLSLASTNLARAPKPDHAHAPEASAPGLGEAGPPAEFVTEVVMDPEHGALALDDAEAPLAPGQKITSPARFLHEQELEAIRHIAEETEATMNRLAGYRKPPRPAAPENTPEMERILRLYPPPKA